LGKFKFGVLEFDKEIPISGGESILIVGDPGVGKTFFCLIIAKETLMNNGKVIWITTDMSPKDVRESMERLECKALDYEKEDKLRFIDCFSSRSGEEPIEEKYYVKDPSALHEVAISINNALNEIKEADLIVCDSLSGLIFDAGASSTLRFMREQIARFRIKNIANIWVLEGGAHEEKTINTYRAICMINLDMWFEAFNGLERYIRIRKAPKAFPSKKIKFEITERGMIIKND